MGIVQCSMNFQRAYCYIDNTINHTQVQLQVSHKVCVFGQPLITLAPSSPNLLRLQKTTVTFSSLAVVLYLPPGLTLQNCTMCSHRIVRFV